MAAAVIVANTRIAVMRGATASAVDHDDDPWTPPVDPEGDGPETLTPNAGIPASIIERTRTVFDPTTSTPRTVRELVGRVSVRPMPSGELLTIRSGDEVRDLRSGDVYVVDGAVTASRSIAGGRALRFTLSETDGA